MRTSCVRVRIGWIVWLFSTAVVPRVRADAVDELLDRLEAAAAETRTIHMVSTMTIHTSHWDHETHMETWVLRGGGNPKIRTQGRAETVDKVGEEQVTTVSEELKIVDGTHQWSQRTRGDKIWVTKKQVIPNEPLAALRVICAQGRTIINPYEELIGERCAVIEVVRGEGDSKTTAKFWISEKHGAILRMTSRQADGGHTRMEATHIEINQPVDESLFEYTPPPDVEVIDLDARGNGSAASETGTPTTQPSDGETRVRSSEKADRLKARKGKRKGKKNRKATGKAKGKAENRDSSTETPGAP